MGQCESRRADHGFTLMETLLAVLIVICLLAVSMVAVVTYRDYLKISELDNAAREIYMAAQNRAVLLDGRGSLERLTVKQDGSNEIRDVEVAVGDGESVSMTFYYISSEDSAVGQLLPEETIESSLWDGHFYIVYEPESASVTDVFFAEKTFPAGDFAEFYRDHRGASKRARMTLSPMTGYYGGDSAQGGSTIALRTPVIRIYNEDELTAEVTWWVPRSLSAEQDKIELELTLSYQENEIVLDEATLGDQYASRVSDEPVESGVLYLMYRRTYLLDSLDPDRQFKDLPWPGDVTPGDDFELTAEVSYTGDTQKVNGASKTVEDNSLFAYDEEGGDSTVAHIGYLRHLQNLRTDYSKVAGKTQAVQIADIDATRGGAGYSFLPIENSELVSYTVQEKASAGERFEIRGLYVKTEEQCAGLFGVFSGQSGSGDGSVASFTVDGVRLVNASVSTTASDGYAGALVGKAANALIQDCRVYWEEDGQGQTDLQYLLGSDSSGYQYQVSGTYAGGLAGDLTGSGVVDSFASTLVSGMYAGGLAGAADTFVLQGSYADCYVDGSTAAAGLVAEAAGTDNKITACYSAGFLSGNVEEGGLCLGDGATSVSSSYSAVLYSAREDENYSNHYPLCKTGEYDNFTHYLFTSYVSADNKYAITYQSLTGADGENILGLFGESSPFSYVGVSASHPYNLQAGVSLSRYPYPAFADMGHYGDWSAEFSEGSLVYWEQYASAQDGTEEGEYRFEGANLDLLKDEAPVGDGYAVALKAKENEAQQAVTIEYTYQTSVGEETETVFYSLAGGPSPDAREIREMPYAKLLQVTNEDKGETYYLAPLPEDIVCSDYASDDFYQKISFVIQGTEQVTGTYYYSPHFASTMVEYDESADAASLAKKNRAVRVRTPRHLYELSLHKEYYASSLGLVYRQELDLDYDTYTAYSDEAGLGLYRTKNGAEQGAIGKSASLPFSCTYNGGCHVISNVAVNESGNYVGLFGYSTGTVRDTVYLGSQVIKKNVSGNNRTAYIGGLVGYNKGTVNNCAVADMAVQIDAFDYCTVYAGGLAGINYGTVSGSSAALKYIAADANNSNVYLGGFLGKNYAGGKVVDCYAVGWVEAARSRVGTVYAAGFAGGNQGAVRNSYSAVALTVSGGAVAYGFCADNTGSGNFYLNGGTYRYDGKEYALQYEDGGSTASATAKTYTPMTNGEAADALGFKSDAPKYGADTTYPYPAVVRDADSQVIHYGQWPEMLTLGSLGVCYWEKEVTTAGSKTNEVYHFSAIIVNPGTENTSVERVSTLCTEHSDGGVIKEYGYGYLYDGDEPTLSVSKTTVNAEKNNVNTTVSAALEAQVESRYKFVVYTTRQEDSSSDTGLYLTGSDRYVVWTLSKNNISYQFYVNPFFGDALAYESSSQKVTVASDVPQVLPGSIESVPYEVRSVRQLRYINWNRVEKNTETVLTYNNNTKKGTRDQFPYLSYYDSGSHVVNDFWKQTHDLDGEKGSYYPIAEYYDSAGGDQNSPANLWGWFGGTYDGADYVIADFNIQGRTASCLGLFGVVYNGKLKNIVLYSSDGQATVTSGTEELNSCWYAMGALAGLAASDLTNVNAVENCSVAGYTIKDQHQKNTDDKYSKWGGSGIGGLLGISNMQLTGCSAVTTIYCTSYETDNIRIGGLVGSCQQSISNCYAGGEIIYNGIAYKQGATPKKGAYIGGIVGGIYMRQIKVGDSAVTIGDSGENMSNALLNCYSYVVLPKPNDYVTSLYAIGGEGDVRSGLGTADVGETTYSHCYYLCDTVLSENGGKYPNVKLTDQDVSEVTAFSYEQMSDGTLLNALNAGGGQFSTVTKETEDGYKIDGKYSFATSQALTGLNYPFPTILTQSNASYASGTVNVHYGDWPLSGIERANGSLPVNIDLFADYSETAAAETDATAGTDVTGAAQQEETIWLSELAQLAGTGTFEVSCANVVDTDSSGDGSLGTGGTEGSDGTGSTESGDGSADAGSGGDADTGSTEAGTEAESELPVAEAFFLDNKGQLVSEYPIASESEVVTLVVRGLREGSAQVTVTYEPTKGNVEITPLTVTVNVTAELQLKPGQETGQMVSEEVSGDGSGGVEDSQSGGSGSSSDDSSLDTAPVSMLTETIVFTNERSDIDLYSFDADGNALPDALKRQIALNVTGVSSVEDDYLSEAAAENVYDEDGETPLPCRGLLSVASRALVGSTSLIVEYEYTYLGRTYQSTSTVNVAVKELVASAEPVELYLDEEDGKSLTYGSEGFSFLIDGQAAVGIEPEIAEVYQGNQAVAAAELNEEDGTLQVTAGGTVGPTTITLSLQFEYGGCSHVVTVYLVVSVYASRVTVSSTAVTDGVLYLYSGSADDATAEISAQLNESGQSAQFTWELSDNLTDYLKTGAAASYQAAARSTESYAAAVGVSEMGAADEAAGSSGEATLQVEEVQAVLHQSADGLSEEELMIEAEEVISPEDGTVPVDAADASGIADAAGSEYTIIEETTGSAAEVDSFYSLQAAEDSGSPYSAGGVILSLTDAAKELTQPVTGTLTVKVTVAEEDQAAREIARTVEVRIMPDRNNTEQTAFLAAEDVDGVLYQQMLAYEEQKKARAKTLAAGETIEPYTELEVQGTTLRAMEVTMPLGGVVPEDDAKKIEVESFWLAVMPRRAVSTVEDQQKKDPQMTEEEKKALENRILPEQEWKAELDADTEHSWEKSWSDYQVTEAGFEIREDEETKEKSVVITLTWSVRHEETGRTVTYETELSPSDLIRVKPTVGAIESEESESAAVDENGLAYFELEFADEAESEDAGEASDGSGAEVSESQTDGSGAEVSESQTDGSGAEVPEGQTDSGNGGAEPPESQTDGSGTESPESQTDGSGAEAGEQQTAAAEEYRETGGSASAEDEEIQVDVILDMQGQ